MRLNNLLSTNLRYSDTSHRHVGQQSPNRQAFRKKALILFICWLFELPVFSAFELCARNRFKRWPSESVASTRWFQHYGRVLWVFVDKILFERRSPGVDVADY